MKEKIYESDLKKIYKHFGAKAQVEKLVEEINELINEIKKTPIDYESFFWECADVFIMLYQFALHDEDFNQKILFKIDRTLDRIKTGYYDKDIKK